VGQRPNLKDRFENYFGKRPGRRLTFSEQFRIYAVESLKRSPAREALQWSAGFTLFFALRDLLFRAKDIRFSELLINFAIAYGIWFVMTLAIREFGRRCKAATQVAGELL